jgi:DNA polymerase-3 subunit delta'
MPPTLEESEDGPPKPRENPRLEGHAAEEKALFDAFHKGRLAHAWLLSGRKGIGKATLAYRFARHALSRGRAGARQDRGPGGGGAGETASPLHVDPRDPVFRRIAAGAHADMATVEIGIDEKSGRRRSEIVVDDVRDVGSFLRLTPAEGGWRVVVIDAADDMNRSAANALLKVLEEPPRRSLLLLVSHSPGRLLPTIRSRCRKLALNPLDAATVARLLQDYCPALSAAEAAAIAELSGGSVGRAVAMAAAGGLALCRQTARLFAALPDLDVGALHGLADLVAKAGAGGRFELWTDLTRRWLAALVRARAGARRPEEAGLEAEDAAPIHRLAALASLDRWLAVWEKVAALLARADDANLDRRQVVLNAFLAVEAAVRA